jgi:hypothetical protein
MSEGRIRLRNFGVPAHFYARRMGSTVPTTAKSLFRNISPVSTLDGIFCKAPRKILKTSDLETMLNAASSIFYGQNIEYILNFDGGL